MNDEFSELIQNISAQFVAEDLKNSDALLVLSALVCDIVMQDPEDEHWKMVDWFQDVLKLAIQQEINNVKRKDLEGRGFNGNEERE